MIRTPKQIWTDEPVMLINLFNAGITMLVAFGIKLSTEQVAAIATFTTLMGGMITRSRVSPSAPTKGDNQ